jgi:hypothetical protein
VIQKTATSVVVFIVFPKHKAVVVFDPMFSWTKAKPTLDPSPQSEEFFQVKAIFASNQFLIAHSELHRALQHECQKFEAA